MGYLDNNSITVDATLTRNARRDLSLGKAINVRYFCLSDAGVDYRLWDETHDLGTDYYGEAIENLPGIEGSSHPGHIFLNKLITLNRQTTMLPTIENIQSSYDFGSRRFSVTLEPLIFPAEAVPNPNFLFVVSDGSLLEFEGGTPVTQYDPWMNAHLASENVEHTKAVQGQVVTITPADVDSTFSVNLLIIEQKLNIWKTITISMDENETAPLRNVLATKDAKGNSSIK